MVLGSWLVPVHSYHYWKWTLLSTCVQQTTTRQKNPRVYGVTCSGRPLCWDKCVSFAVFVRDNKRCSYSRSLQKGMLIVRWLFQDASVVNLCSLVLERYIATVKAYKYVTFMARRRVVQMIFVIWKITVIFILLKSSLWISLNLSSLLNIFIWFVVIFFEFITCCMVIFCLVFMLRIVLKQNRAVTILTRQLRFNHRVSHKPYEKSAVLIMAVVSGLLVVCNVPYLRFGF